MITRKSTTGTIHTRPDKSVKESREEKEKTNKKFRLI